MDEKCRQEHEQMRQRILAITRVIFGIEDTSAIELFGVLHRTAHISETLETKISENMDLSGPRWRLLVRLLAEEHMGNREGITPTQLSQHQRVSKNTISALLRGLEDQGLIERALDPSDLRVFRIQLTQAGRDFITKMAPQNVERLNQLLKGFSKEEIRQLIQLLEKLQGNLMDAINDRDLFQG